MQQYRSLKKNCKYDIAKAKKNNSKLLECEEERKKNKRMLAGRPHHFGCN